MNLNEAVGLLSPQQEWPEQATRWADLGCGSGLFTYALAQFLPDGSATCAADKAMPALKPLANPNKVNIEPVRLDFIREDWPFRDLDGILMANSLHYVADKPGFIQKLQSCLKPAHQLILVEYDTEVGNPWVPYPVSFNRLSDLMIPAGYEAVRKLAERPSVFGPRMIYSASAAKCI